MSTAASVKRELCPWLPPENIRVSTPWWRGANDPRITDEQVSTAVAELKQVLEEYGVADMPLAVDEADGSVFTALAQHGLTVVSGYDAIFDARLVKSDDELKLIDMSASLVDGVYGHLVDFIKPGVRENEVVAEIYQWLIAHGVDHISGVNCVSGPRSNPHPHDYSDRMIRPGELVFIDIMSHYLGYATCYYRTFAVTKATQRQRDVYARANEWLEASIDVVRPGITTADIASQWPSAKDLGYPSERAAMGLAIGHGIGLSHHEKPFINRLYSLDNPSPIEKNMHFALETFCGDGDDGARIESQVIVTADGRRVITQWPSSELLVLAEW
jgi:Xaa-Pro dipeptidase